MSLPVPRQARAIATRERLLAATADCLAEQGYAGTSTMAICQRAQVSQGALFKHFPSKTMLLVAAAERTLAEFVAAFRDAVPADSSPGDGLARAIASLWRIFCAARMRSIFELYLAARTDEELRQLLEPVLAEHGENLYREACRVFPIAAAREGFRDSVDLVIYAMQGAALGISVRTATERADLERRFVFIARRELEQLLHQGASGS